LNFLLHRKGVLKLKKAQFLKIAPLKLRIAAELIY